MKPILEFCCVVIILISEFSCSSLREMSRLKECEFTLAGIEQIKVAGIDISGRKSMNQLSLTDATKILAASSQGEIPSSLILNVQVKNPNSKRAALNKIEYIAFLDGQQVFTGSMDKRVEIAEMGTGIFPLAVHFDLLKVLSGSTGQSAINLIFNLAGSATTPSQILLKIKPSIMVAGKMIPYPGWVDVKKEITNTKLK